MTASTYFTRTSIYAQLILIVLSNTINQYLFVFFNRYGVVIDGERGNRPHILSQEELLNQAVSVLVIVLKILSIKLIE